MNYIEKFGNLGMGLFVHFGLYSIVGKGEWYFTMGKGIDIAEYKSLVNKFKIKKSWAKDLVKLAKDSGCKYINLTTRHHDGFSLFDTKGLSDFDILHSATGRDLIKEFVNECNKEGIVPFFYHTLLDWTHPDYENNFDAYIDYLINSIEVLCSSYGKIGGLWFDGMWNKPNENWQEDRLYSTIRKHQAEAMIINNTGLSELGKVGHPEIDSVTFERGNPSYVDQSDKQRAGEMCQILNDHWGYAANDCNYKSVKELIENLIDCRKYNCNFLLNTGLKGDGSVNSMDKYLLLEVGKWIKANKNFIYSAKSSDVTAKNADMLQICSDYYAVSKNVSMSADPNVAINGEENLITIDTDKKITNAIWLDNGEEINLIDNNKFYIKSFAYGTSLFARVAKFNLE